MFSRVEVKADSELAKSSPTSELRPGVSLERQSLSKVHVIDPLADDRWEEFVSNHPRSSMFHGRGWLQALQRTYGYKPLVYTTTGPGQALHNGIVFCDVNSWLTGERLVSLPFSDHCEPLVETEEEFKAIVAVLSEWITSSAHQYFELRPLNPLQLPANLVHVHETYAFHQLDLQPDLESIFKAFHKDSVQRKIKRAEREGVEYREGAEQIEEFYRLMVITRRRHRVPPQPKEWFKTLINCFGDSLTLRMAFHQGKAIAGMLTIRHKDAYVYKYGCSDVRYNNLGGIHLLYWTSIQHAKKLNCKVFDFGRCDSDQEGLMLFKRRWGAVQSTLQYHRFAAHGKPGLTFQPAGSTFRMRIAEQIFAHSPAPILSWMGKFLYKHVG